MELLRSSPLQKLNAALFTDKKVEVWVKRDDLIHPFISGNKSRKLHFILDDARKKGKTHLVSFGGAFSNHLLALASAAAENGFTSTAFVRGEDVQNDTLFLCRMLSMQLIFTNRESYRNKDALFTHHFSGDESAYFIDEGGAGELGAKGCALLIDELPRTFDHLFCACGTGTTAAGLINGLSAKKLPTKVHVISALKNGSFLRDEIDKLLHKPQVYQLHTGYDFGGYAKATAQLLSFIQNFIAKTGIVIDPVYTGKMFYALFEEINFGLIEEGSTVLAIHTGGTMGLLGMKSQFFPERG